MFGCWVLRVWLLVRGRVWCRDLVGFWFCGDGGGDGGDGYGDDGG